MGYSKRFTLKDIFNNPKLQGKIPLINYKETTDEQGKTHRNTSAKTLMKSLYDISKASAKPYYRPLNATKSGNVIEIGGTLKGDYDTAYNAVYDGIVKSKTMLLYTVNNIDMIRTALKQSEKKKPVPKLSLTAGSMLEIESMSKQQLGILMRQVMENLYYNDDFAEVQAKYKVENLTVGKYKNDYADRKEKWQRRVGDI